MKRVFIIAIGVATTLTATTLQAAFDGTVNIASTRPVNGGSGIYGGGAFTADITSGLSTVIGGNGLAGALGTGFSTFCIEYNEHISLPGNYSANVDFAAINGSGGPNPDPVSKATAWLYSQFRAGTLAANAPGYANDNTQNDALQQAIWWLEQETSAYVAGAPANSETLFNNYLVAAAVAATGAASADVARGIDANGAYGVMALNLYALNGTLADVAQSQLAIVPEPTTVIAGALLLLPFGASTVRFIRRRRMA